VLALHEHETGPTDLDSVGGRDLARAAIDAPAALDPWTARQSIVKQPPQRAARHQTSLGLRRIGDHRKCIDNSKNDWIRSTNTSIVGDAASSMQRFIGHHASPESSGCVHGRGCHHACIEWQREAIH